MRKQFVTTMQDILQNDPKTVLLLGDIGVFGFRNEIQSLPLRVKNIGILEQATIGVAAGYAKTGLIPFVHTIAPFLVERALEQLKVDFGYQKLNGNFISVGSSYDYAALGCTHHCPGDVAVLSTIPNMQIFCPGTSQEFDFLLKNNYNNMHPSYFRLSEFENNESFLLTLGEGKVIKTGTQATIICFGNMLTTTLNATKELDVTVIYYNSVCPLNLDVVLDNLNKKIIIIEPFYRGSVNHLLTKIQEVHPVQILNIGIPRTFLYNYGSKKEHDKKLNLDENGIKNTIITWLH